MMYSLTEFKKRKIFMTIGAMLGIFVLSLVFLKDVEDIK